MLELNEIENRLKFLALKVKIKKSFDSLEKLNYIREKIDGQIFSNDDPYGEENWED